MNKDFIYYFEVSAKFHFTYFIKGWYKRHDNTLVTLKDIGCRHHNVIATVFKEERNLPHLGEPSAVGFTIQFLLKEAVFPKNIFIDITFSDGTYDTFTDSFIGERMRADKHTKVSKKFWEIIAESAYKKVLDVGGRARSGLDRSKEFLGKEVTIIDIIKDDNVDVVGDAHLMSKYFEPNSFDVVYCISVFEHLIMPWKVALEMNKVMRIGAVGLIHTHQTVGMHDLPWDFFRYSDTSWKGIFNAYTGFEIIETEMNDVCYIIPFAYKDKYEDAEKSAGYEGSAVLVRKIGETKLEWPLGADDVTGDMYPDHPDNNKLEHYEQI